MLMMVYSVDKRAWLKKSYFSTKICCGYSKVLKEAALLSALLTNLFSPRASWAPKTK